ncbi:MAG: phage holin family protein [Bacteroidota bacterium]
MHRFFDTLYTTIVQFWEQLPELKTVLVYVFIGWMLAPVVQFVERFLWSDWEFAAFLGILIILDTLTGLIAAWQTRSVSSRKLERVLIKVTAYAVLLITMHVLSHHTIAGKPNTILAAIVPYFDALIYAAILFREALSINENLAALGHPILPPFIIRRLERFQENGLKDLDPEATAKREVQQ